MKLLHLVGVITKKFVTMHGHMNVKKEMCLKAVRMEQSSILVLLASCLQTCTTYTLAECTVNKLLMMDRRTVRNM